MLQGIFTMNVFLLSLANFEHFARRLGCRRERVPKMTLPLTGGGHG
jgi:hypothetical protein